jgi:hypothetical protein
MSSAVLSTATAAVLSAATAASFRQSCAGFEPELLSGADCAALAEELAAPPGRALGAQPAEPAEPAEPAMRLVRPGRWIATSGGPPTPQRRPGGPNTPEAAQHLGRRLDNRWVKLNGSVEVFMKRGGRWLGCREEK